MILLHRVVQRRKPLNPHLQLVTALDGADAAGGAGENHIARQQRHVRGDEADQFVRLENELARVRVLAELAVLELLDVQMVCVNLRLHQRTERREGVERFAARPLAVGFLDDAVADVLRRRVTKNVARRLRG